MSMDMYKSFSEPLPDDYTLKHFGPPVIGTPQLRLEIVLAEIEDDGDEYQFCYHVANHSQLPAYPQIAAVRFPVGKVHGIHQIDADGWERALLADTFCLFWTEDPAEMRPPGYDGIYLVLHSRTDQTQSGFAVPYSPFGLSYDPVPLSLPAALMGEDIDLQDRPSVILDATTSGARENGQTTGVQSAGELVQCAGCGGMVDENRVEEWDSELYCPDCFGWCYECLEDAPKCELVLMNGQYYCSECASKDKVALKTLPSDLEDE